MDLPRLLAPEVLPSAASFLLLVGLAVLARRWGVPRALNPAIPTVLGGALLFAGGDWLTLVTDSVPLYEAGVVLLYLGLCAMVPAYLLAAVRLGELRGETPPAWTAGWLRAALPWSLAFGLVVVTNPWHGWMVEARPDALNVYRPLWYPFAITCYAWMFASVAASLEIARRTRSTATRVQARLVAGAALLPVAGNAVYLAWREELAFDPTSLGVLAASAIYLLGIVRRKLPVMGPTDLDELLGGEPEPTLVVDDAGRLRHANAGAEALLERTPQVGEPAFPALMEALAQGERGRPVVTRELAADLLADEQPVYGHLYRLRGSRRFVRIRSSPLADPSGRRLHCLRIRDETELQQLFESVSEQTATLEAVIAATDEGVIVHTVDSVRFANDQFHEIWRTPPALRGVPDGSALVDAYLPMVRDRDVFLGALEATRRDPTVEVHDEIRLLDGRTLERVSLPLRRGEEVIGRVWRVRDVTEQRRTEEAARRGQQLESLGVLAGGIAHDFNNLLVAVMGNASLALADVPEGSAVRTLLRDIERAAEQASDLTRQLLAFAGKGRLASVSLDLNALVRDVVSLLRTSLPAPLEVRLALADGLPAVEGDASQVRQVVMNLLLNAADAVGADAGRVTLTTSEESVDAATPVLPGEPPLQPGRYVVLRVEDTGCGIEEWVLPRIFEPFFTTKFAGRGLGLAASLGIARSHGGAVRVESRPGGGSTFELLLPAGGIAVPQPAERPLEDVSDWRSEATVLVVEDEPEVARVARRMLESAGLRVIVAHDGRAGLEAHAEQGGKVDAVLLDLTMPRLGGLAVYRELRQRDPGLPVVLTSGFPEPEAGEGVAGERPAAFVKKPYRRAVLLRAVREALEASGRA